MPQYPAPAEQWLSNELAALKLAVGALKSQATQYVVDTAGVCKAIIGNVASDPTGAGTGLSGWGVAVRLANGTWVLAGTGQVQQPAGAMTSQTRVLGTAYRPNTERATLVITTLSLSSAAASNSFAEVLMDSANPPTTTISLPQVENANASAVKIQVPVTFEVPAGFYYKIAKGAGSVIIISTFEYTR